MTGHWEFTYGAARVKEVVDKDFAGRIDFVAQNVSTADFGDPVFAPYVMQRDQRRRRSRSSARRFPTRRSRIRATSCRSGRSASRKRDCRRRSTRRARKGAQVVVLLSHNGMDVDLKLASRVTGIDAILGGHTHDGVPQPTLVSNRGGKTLVTNAGSNGKFLGRARLRRAQAARSPIFATGCVPVFANLLPPDREMDALIAQSARAVRGASSSEKLAVTEASCCIGAAISTARSTSCCCDALMAEKNAEIAFSPGFRWGPTLLPGEAIRYEDLLDQTAITYPYVTVNKLTGETIKTILEDVADNLFNPDPYYQQGGDMVRVGGMRYAIDPYARERPPHHADGAAAASRSRRASSTRSPAGRRWPKRRRPRAASRSGTSRALPARAEDDRATGAEPAEARGCWRGPRPRVLNGVGVVFPDGVGRWVVSCRGKTTPTPFTNRSSLTLPRSLTHFYFTVTRANLRLPACTTTVAPGRDRPAPCRRRRRRRPSARAAR